MTMTDQTKALLDAIRLRTAANQGALVRRQIVAKTISSTVEKTTRPR
jgi:hypothetical protein